MNCKNCGAEIKEGQKFCQGCGSKIEQEPVVEPKEPVNENPINDTNKNSNPVNVVGNNNNNNSNVNTNVNSTKKAEVGKGFRIASLVLGIISLLFNVVALPLAIVGLILGIVYNVKNKKTPAGLVLNIIAIVLSIIICVFFSMLIGMIGAKIEENGGLEGLEKFLTELEEKIEDYEPEIEINNNSSFTTSNKNNNSSSKYKYVGSDEYGYIEVPNNWGKFYDVDGTSALQYSYGNSWIVTIYATDEVDSKYKYASAVYDKLKKEDVEDLEMKFDFITDDYIVAYKISCYYPDENKYLSTWFFEDDEKEKVHYIAIEGPDEDSEYFDLIDTFVFEK